MLTPQPTVSRKSRMKKRRTRPGSAPGTLIADPAAPKPVIRMISYDEGTTLDRPIPDVATLRKFMADKRKVTWIDVTGLGDVKLLEEIAAIFGIHSLALEDVVNVHQRPKIDEYKDHTFIVLRMSETNGNFVPEQFSIFLGKDYVLSFQEKPGDCFDPIRTRINQKNSRIRQEGADYLVYSLIDSVTDSYFPILERYGEAIELLEDQVLKNSDPEFMHELHIIRRNLMLIRRTMWPLRDVLNSLTRDPTPFISDNIKVYFRDCYDHCFQLIDIVDTARELAGNITDLYHSGASVRMNEIMTVLTIMTTTFIPLSFVASVYGMNFDRDVSPWNMPELGWRLGYPFALSVMLAIAVSMMGYFWHKGWIGPKRKKAVTAASQLPDKNQSYSNSPPDPASDSGLAHKPSQPPAPAAPPGRQNQDVPASLPLIK